MSFIDENRNTDMGSQFKTKFQFYQITLIFSILFSLLGFSYNVWRMEVSEQNNTIRTASFEMLVELSSLEQLVYIAHYDKDLTEGSPRKGWVKVGLIGDLSVLTDPSIEKKSANLTAVWTDAWNVIEQDNAAVDRVVEGIDSVREEIKRVLKALD
jgi:hypothetical protein